VSLWRHLSLSTRIYWDWAPRSTANPARSRCGNVHPRDERVLGSSPESIRAASSFSPRARVRGSSCGFAGDFKSSARRPMPAISIGRLARVSAVYRSVVSLRGMRPTPARSRAGPAGRQLFRGNLPRCPCSSSASFLCAAPQRRSGLDRHRSRSDDRVAHADIGRRPALHGAAAGPEPDFGERLFDAGPPGKAAPAALLQSAGRELLSGSAPGLSARRAAPGGRRRGSITRKTVAYLHVGRSSKAPAMRRRFRRHRAAYRRRNASERELGRDQELNRFDVRIAVQGKARSMCRTFPKAERASGAQAEPTSLAHAYSTGFRRGRPGSPGRRTPRPNAKTAGMGYQSV